MRGPGLKGWGARDGTLYNDAPNADKQRNRVEMLANDLSFEICFGELLASSAFMIFTGVKAGANSNNSTTNTLCETDLSMRHSF